MSFRSMQEEEQAPGQSGPGKSVGPSPWIKIFLALNLLALLGMFVWEMGGPPFKSDEQTQAEIERKKEEVSKALALNPPAVDYAGTLSGEIKYTVDAIDSATWVHFNLSKVTLFRSKALARERLDWDIAFRRAKIVTNGGSTNPNGKAAVAIAGDGKIFDSVTSAPSSGYQVDEGRSSMAETKNPALDKWYVYDFWTHRLTPKKRVYLLRTSDGHYAKFQILDYYCGTVSGCYTFRYVYQGAEKTTFGAQTDGK